MSGLPPPSYEEASASHGAPPPAHGSAGSKHPTAAEEKRQMAASMEAGDKVLKIWHAASGNSLITAADEQTPIYNVIDSRAPNEDEQRAESERVYAAYQNHQHSGSAGMQRQDASSSDVPGDVQFARDIQRERADPYASQNSRQRVTDLWHLTVRRGGDRNGPVLAVIKRHINTSSAVGIELHGEKFGIEQHAGFPHKKYEFTWRSRVFTWSKTHKAPGTSRLDSGSYHCRDAKKVVYAYATPEDDRCDGSMHFEQEALDEGLLDVMTVTAFIMRDLDTERRTPMYSGVYGAGGYGPYANPYLSSAYGYYPMGFGYGGIGYGGFGYPLLI